MINTIDHHHWINSELLNSIEPKIHLSTIESWETLEYLIWCIIETHHLCQNHPEFPFSASDQILAASGSSCRLEDTHYHFAPGVATYQQLFTTFWLIKRQLGFTAMVNKLIIHRLLIQIMAVMSTSWCSGPSPMRDATCHCCCQHWWFLKQTNLCDLRKNGAVVDIGGL